MLLAGENKKRDLEPADDSYDNVYIELVNQDGEKVERKVDKVSNMNYGRMGRGRRSTTFTLVGIFGFDG